MTERQSIPEWCQPGKTVVEFRERRSCRYGRVLDWRPLRGQESLHPVVSWKVGRYTFAAYANLAFLEPASFLDREKLLDAPLSMPHSLGCRVEFCRVQKKQPKFKIWMTDASQVGWQEIDHLPPFATGTMVDLSPEYGEVIEDPCLSNYLQQRELVTEPRFLLPLHLLKVTRPSYQLRVPKTVLNRKSRKDLPIPGQLNLFG